MVSKYKFCNRIPMYKIYLVQFYDSFEFCVLENTQEKNGFERNHIAIVGIHSYFCDGIICFLTSLYSSNNSS